MVLVIITMEVAGGCMEDPISSSIKMIADVGLTDCTMVSIKAPSLVVTYRVMFAGTIVVIFSTIDPSWWRVSVSTDPSGSVAMLI